MKEKVIKWTQDYFNKSNGKVAIIGISGGKDSTVCAKILVEALGKENVIGVLMPQGVQHDINVSNRVVEWLGIKSLEVNIKEAVDHLYGELIPQFSYPLNSVVKSNTPARVRMTTLYAVAGMFEGARVCNTCNLSEDYVGYATKFGDSAGDFALLQDLTVTEVKELGRALGVPSDFVDKVPEDGLCGKTDEDNLGFTYEQLDAYIAKNEGSLELKEKIQKMNKLNEHKLVPMPKFTKETFEEDGIKSKTEKKEKI